MYLQLLLLLHVFVYFNWISSPLRVFVFKHTQGHRLLQLCAMRSSSLLLLSFFMGVCDVQGASDLRICAFNLHNFGESKAKKSNVMHTLTRVRHKVIWLSLIFDLCLSKANHGCIMRTGYQTLRWCPLTWMILTGPTNFTSGWHHALSFRLWQSFINLKPLWIKNS